MGKVVIIESKSIGEYLRQLEGIGENLDEYEHVYGYSLAQTEPRMPTFDYPPCDVTPTERLTNFELPCDGPG
jgi:lysine 2,3-aminomutase